MSPSHPAKVPPRTAIRWMIRRDIPQVLRAEQECYANGWTEDDFLRCLLQCNCIGMVTVQGEEVIGYMIYELERAEIHLLNLAVRPEFRRLGVGSQMVAKLVAKLSGNQRQRVFLDVRESNLEAQLFFRAQGLKAVRVLRGYYEDTDEDAYLMEYRYASEEGGQPGEAVNRIINYQ
jgi:ribosomal-protein-alanine N-acetyltransferase